MDTRVYVYIYIYGGSGNERATRRGSRSRLAD